LDIAADLVLMLDDVTVDPATGQAEDRLDMRAMMMGREGNLLLVNGQPSNGSITVAPGQRSRLRLVNAANARFFHLAVGDGALVQIGSDGGLLPAPRPLNQLLLVPGERAEVVLETAGATLTALPYERAQGAGADGPMPLVRFVSSGAAPVTPLPLPATLRQLETLAATAPGTALRLGERMAHHSWRFTINDRSFPDVPLIDATLDTRARWSIENDSGMDHPFHLHGFFFQQAGIPEWKDTINIPAQSVVELIVDFAARADGAAGDWLYHCHILEHAEGGMMGEVHVD
jgi:FtsP/CotA-like multicopper oxidase with cupredoxin domain